MSDDTRDHWSILTAIVLFAAVALLIAWDLIVDYGEGAGWRHLVIEFFVLLAAAGGIVLLWLQLNRTHSDLAKARVAAEQWRRENHELLQGLGVAIENQFARWKLTKAQAEVGLLLLKGLSHKEAAEVRRLLVPECIRGGMNYNMMRLRLCLNPTVRNGKYLPRPVIRLPNITGK